MTDRSDDERGVVGAESGPWVTTDGQGTYRGYHDPDARGLPETITLLLAEVEDRDPTEVVEEFDRYVDPDALDALFRPRPNGQPRGPGHVEISVAGYDVTAYSDGEIVVEE